MSAATIWSARADRFDRQEQRCLALGNIAGSVLAARNAHRCRVAALKAGAR